MASGVPFLVTTHRFVHVQKLAFGPEGCFLGDLKIRCFDPL